MLYVERGILEYCNFASEHVPLCFLLHCPKTFNKFGICSSAIFEAVDLLFLFHNTLGHKNELSINRSMGKCVAKIDHHYTITAIAYELNQTNYISPFKKIQSRKILILFSAFAHYCSIPELNQHYISVWQNKSILNKLNE